MQTAKPVDPNIITLSGRLSYPNLFEAVKVMDNPTLKFSAALIMDKKADAKSIKAVQARIDALVKETFKGKAIPADKLCLKDGSTKDKPGYGDGVMFIAASTETRPVVVDRDKTPLVAQDGKPYAGCYVNMSVRLWAQDNKFGKRINATLRWVQFAKDGEAFGAAPVDTDEIEEVADDSDDI